MKADTQNDGRYNFSDMNKKQRENTAKYFYDISKGIALVVVVGNIVRGKWSITTLLLGLVATFAFWAWGYVIDGGYNDDRL